MHNYDLQSECAEVILLTAFVFAETSGQCYRDNKALSLRTAGFGFKLQSFATNHPRTFCLKVLCTAKPKAE